MEYLETRYNQVSLPIKMYFEFDLKKEDYEGIEGEPLKKGDYPNKRQIYDFMIIAKELLKKGDEGITNKMEIYDIEKKRAYLMMEEIKMYIDSDDDFAHEEELRDWFEVIDNFRKMQKEQLKIVSKTKTDDKEDLKILGVDETDEEIEHTTSIQRKVVGFLKKYPDKTQNEIAKMAGTTPSNVSMIKNRFMK